MSKKLNGFLIKFSDNKYIDEIKHGNIFLQNINYFRHLEDSEIPGIKDPDEISSVLTLDQNSSKLFIQHSKSNIPYIESCNFSAKFSVKYDFSNNICISSFVYLDAKKDFDYKNNNIYTLKNKIISELSEQFNGRPCIIIPLGNFRELLLNNLKDYKKINNIKDVKMDIVNYYVNSNIKELKKKETLPEVMKTAFYKSEYFKSQREFRIAILTDDIDPIHLNNESNFQFSHLELSSPEQLKYLFYQAS